MTAFNYEAYFAVLRGDGHLTQAVVDLNNRALAAGFALPPPVHPATGDPDWITIGRALIGTKEAPGAADNPVVLKMFVDAGAPWAKHDSLAWCGGYVGACLHNAGVAIPPNGTALTALMWATWGQPCEPQLGAVGVKKRDGGGHVFFIVAITDDMRCYKALSGNQNNEVCIEDVPISEVIAIRWPAGMAPLGIDLPAMKAGTISGNES